MTQLHIHDDKFYDLASAQTQKSQLSVPLPPSKGDRDLLGSQAYDILERKDT
jgi:hypothetical protein